MNPNQLMRIAKGLSAGQLRSSRRGRPNQEELRRAVSTAYYALFSALARSAADIFVGRSAAARKSQVWVQTYRSLNHRQAKAQCDKIVKGQNSPAFDQRIVAFAEAFVNMQTQRHEADYNPAATFYRTDVQTRIGAAEQALAGLTSCPISERRNFAAFVMHRGRES